LLCDFLQLLISDLVNHEFVPLLAWWQPYAEQCLFSVEAPLLELLKGWRFECQVEVFKAQLHVLDLAFECVQELEVIKEVDAGFSLDYCDIENLIGRIICQLIDVLERSVDHFQDLLVLI